ncbi:putative plant disease resistance response protein [Rosa chinensis]|uniref:Dirigent protein n=1 Tax=Rosa chinensis TaxID=74649 RepID=A0A2P6S2A7_ROSCH|nr:dirigent protein 1 [Rosa chinensis]PRQ52824.1 putative plant disease resistance response protein [Rosa chinensis]
MALNFIPKLTPHLSPVFLLVLSVTVFLAPVEQSGSEKEFEMKYYIMEIQSGPNATVVPGTGIAGKLWSPTNWGTILVCHNPFVEDPSPYSRKVGQVRGLEVASSKDGEYNYICSSTMFTRSEYNGSTLQAQGTFNRASRGASVLSIVGGTGTFKGARGIAMLQTYSASFLLFIIKFSLPK